jgi:chloramphenicol O-acetyltransferase type A
MTARVLADYPRRPHLEFYRSNPSPFYAVTFELEAANIRARAREVNGSTYAALCWGFHRALLKIEAFRTRLVGEDVVLYDTLRIGMTVPGPHRTFTFATHEWDESGERFLKAAREEIARSSESVNLSRGNEPDFAYYTAVPGVPFLGITHVPHRDRAAGQPMTAFGRFREEGDKLYVPVGLQVNHMYVDGLDVGDLYEGAQASYREAF